MANKIRARCSAGVYVPGSFHSMRCSRNATVEREGKPYCTQHDPVKVAEKRAARHQEWREKSDSNRKALKEAAAIQAERDRKAEAYDALRQLAADLAGALGAVVTEYEQETGHLHEWYGAAFKHSAEIAREALEKARAAGVLP